MDSLVEENSDGGKAISHMWISGSDQFFFCKEPIETLADFEGRKVRSHGSALSDWIEGFGAAAQFVAFAEVYTAQERRVLHCGVTVALASVPQRWYEVTTYMVRPLATQALNTIIMSSTSGTTCRQTSSRIWWRRVRATNWRAFGSLLRGTRCGYHETYRLA